MNAKGVAMKFRKDVLCAICILSISWVPLAALAAEEVKVTLSNPDDKTLAEAGVISIRIENVGDEPASIYAMKTPFAIKDDRLPNPQFEVRDSSGREMSYVGRNVKPGPVSPSSFITLQPGEAISKDVDIAADYDLKEGGYAVRFNIDLGVRPIVDGPDGVTRQDIHVNSQKQASSNILNVWISPSLRDARKRDLSSLMAAQEQQYICSSSQSWSLSGVILEAQSQSYAALNSLTSSYQWTYDDYHTVVGGNNTDPRYTYWFGEYDTSVPPNDPSTDNTQIDKKMMAIYTRLHYPSFSFECGCDPSKYPPEVRAWAESDNPYHMHICDSFWTDPLTGGLSSQVGTLIHETSHFNDGVGGTVDYAYGPTAVHNLALTDRWKAVRNADNYEFYIIDAQRQ